MKSQSIFISSNIKLCRSLIGLSQELFADALKLNRTKIAYYETVSDPPIETLISIADYLGLSLDTLCRVDISRNFEISKTVVNRFQNTGKNKKKQPVKEELSDSKEILKVVKNIEKMMKEKLVLK